jgi:SSS family transporter
MRTLDWLVLAGTLVAIVAYGAWKSRKVKDAEAWLRGGRELRWWTIGLSIMATQASAITFLSTPGQAYEDGMGFVQFYFGLPVAMVILSATIVPLYYRLKVYTAYEYLEGRFDRKTRQLTALLFLVQRGLGAGLSIYAPAIIVSSVLGWPLQWTNLAIGVLVIGYTVSGGTKVVSQTQTWQMVVMLGGMALALALVVHALPPSVSTAGAVRVAGALGKMNVVDFSPRLDTRYTFWSGMTGGLFVALAYFGTDQSQVQRYLSGSSLAESRLGLLFNGLVKVPMQFFILFVGLMVFVFYQFHEPPLFFHQAEAERVYATPHAAELRALEAEHGRAFHDKRAALERLVAASAAGDGAAESKARGEARAADAAVQALRGRAKKVIAAALPGAETQDADYVFITFVTKQLPSGVVGLLLAVIFCAAMSATASALNALGSTSVVDFYKASFRPGASDAHYLLAAKVFTVLWGVVAMAFAAFASLVDNLIQAVNILGSIFYGPMLGVFLVGFFLRRVRATPVFVATLVAQAAVIAVFALSRIGFLWYNVIGCAIVVAVALGIDAATPRTREPALPGAP